MSEHITELYDGRIGTSSEQRLLAARVHWMASQVDGPEVLDVGCEQGLAALLLAREGRRATGIDRDPEMIQWAQQHAAGEQESVRTRLSYEVAEAADLPFPDDRFDAVVLGGVLEEQVDPSVVVREAVRVLKPGGRLTLTALYAELRGPPFGEPLYLLGLIGLLAEWIEVDDIALLDRYVALAGSASTERPAKPDEALWRQALDVAERSLARSLEESLSADRTQQDDRHERLSAELMEARERLAAASAERQAAVGQAEAAEQRLALAEGRVRELQGELGAQTTRIARAEAELHALRDVQARIPLLEQRRTELERRSADLEQEAGTLKTALGRAAQRVAVIEAERAALAREASEAGAEAARLEAALGSERETTRAARSEIAESRTEARTARAEVAELGDSIDRLKARAGEQAQRIDSLEQSLASAEADRRRLDQRWRHATDRAQQLERALADARPTDEQPRAEPDKPSGPGDTPSGGEVPARRYQTRPATPSPRVLHLLARSLPHAASPLALDRHALLVAQCSSGLDSSAMTRLDFPWDLGVADPPICEIIDGITYSRLRDPSHAPGEDSLQSAIRIGEELLEIVEPDILHAASLDVAPLALALAEHHSLRCVVELASDSAAEQPLDPELLAAADQVVALSEQQRDRAVTAGVPAARVLVIPAFVDTARFAAADHTAANGRRSVAIGALAYDTGSPAVQALHEAVASTARPVRGVVARVLAAGAGTPGGSSPGGGDPESAAQAGREVLETEIAAADIPAWLARMDVVIAATPYEALDAMAAGTPVVGVAGALDLAPALDALAPLLSDRRLRARRGAAARKTIETQNTGSAVQAYSRLYASGAAS